MGRQGARHLASIVLILATLVLAPACGGDDEQKPPGANEPAVDLTYELFETTRTLGEETLAALASVSDDRTAMTFVETTGELDGLEPDDVLLAGVTEATPSGLLLRVSSVEPDGDGVVVRGAPVSVFHAFRRLDLRVTGLAPRGDENELLPPPAEPPLGATREPLTVSVPLGAQSFDEPLFEGDQELSDEDRVNATGKLVETVTIDFWLHFDWENLSPAEAFGALDNLLDSLDDLFSGDPPDLGDILGLRMGFSVHGDAEVDLHVTGKSSLHYEETFAFAPPYVLPPIVIGPLVFEPQIDMTAHFEGGVPGSVDMQFGFGAGFGLGFEYDDGLETSISGPTFSAVAPTPTVTASASLRAELILTLNLRLLGFLGPYASLIPYGNLEVDRFAEPCYELTAGIDGEVGASLGIYGHTLKKIKGPHFAIGDALELGDGECEPLPDPAPTDNLITPWSKSYGGDLERSLGTDEGYTSLEPSHDGRLLLASSGANAVLKVTEAGDVIWARTLEQPSRPDFPRLDPQHAVPMLDTGILVSTDQGVLVKLTQNGEVEWGAQLESDHDGEGYWAAARVGDAIWLGGNHRLLASTERQAWLVGLEPDGSVAFSWTWGEADRRESIRHILPLDDGALVVGEAGGRGFLHYVNSDGTVRWAKHVDDCAAEDLVLSTAILTDDDNLVIGGWFYATDTHGLVFRMSRDGSENEPAWATRTNVEGEILGPEIRSLHQLSTGELRIVGRYAEPSGDRVFAAMADSIGRFGWLRRYGAEDGTAPPTSRITTQGGLLVATGSATLEPNPGGFWLFEVPAPTGNIEFSSGSGVAMDDLTPTSVEACLVLEDAPATTTALELPMTLVDVELAEPEYVVHEQ
jgi:hypothetical protein